MTINQVYRLYRYCLLHGEAVGGEFPDWKTVKTGIENGSAIANENDDYAYIRLYANHISPHTAKLIQYNKKEI